MTITTYTLNLGNTASLDSFDDVTHMAFGSGTTSPTINDTTLDTETLRVIITESVKDTINNTYRFTGVVPLTKLNSSTINEIALFNAASSGTMSARIVLASGLTKTSDEELKFILLIEVDTINS